MAVDIKGGGFNSKADRILNSFANLSNPKNKNFNATLDVDTSPGEKSINTFIKNQESKEITLEANIDKKSLKGELSDVARIIENYKKSNSYDPIKIFNSKEVQKDAQIIIDSLDEVQKKVNDGKSIKKSEAEGLLKQYKILEKYYSDVGKKVPQQYQTAMKDAIKSSAESLQNKYLVRNDKKKLDLNLGSVKLDEQHINNIYSEAIQNSKEFQKWADIEVKSMSEMNSKALESQTKINEEIKKGQKIVENAEKSSADLNDKQRKLLENNQKLLDEWQQIQLGDKSNNDVQQKTENSLLEEKKKILKEETESLRENTDAKRETAQEQLDKYLESESREHRENADAINEETNAQNRLNDSKKEESNIIDFQSAVNNVNDINEETEALKRQLGVQQGLISVKKKESGDRRLGYGQGDIKIKDEQGNISNVVESEIGIKNLSSQLKSLKTEFNSLLKSSDRLYDTEKVSKFNERLSEQIVELGKLSVQFNEQKKALKNTYGQDIENNFYVQQLKREFADVSSSYINTMSKFASDSENKFETSLKKKSYTADFVNEVEKAQQVIVEFQAFLSSHDNSKFFSPDDIVNIRKYVDAINKVKVGLTDNANLQATTADVDKYLTKIAKDLQNTKMSPGLRADFELLQAQLKEVRVDSDQTKKGLAAINRVELGELINRFKELDQTLWSTNQNGSSFLDTTLKRAQSMTASFLARYLSLYDIVRYIRQISTTVIEVDTALTELRKVSDTTNSRLQQSFTNSAKTAKELGATITDVINSTSDWSRMGYNINQSEELARLTTLYQNVGDGITQEEASQSLVSTLQGFQMDVSESSKIVDVYNEVANNFAISSGGIGEAMQRSSAALNAANTSFEKSVALVTAANEVQQDPDVVGTAFKTLQARIRGASTDLEELGEETDDYVNSTSKLQGLVKGLTGFDIMTPDGTGYKDIYDILMGIGEQWENLSDIDQAK